MNIDEFAKFIILAAEDSFSDDGYLEPMAFFVPKAEPGTLIMCPHEADKSKSDALITVLQSIAIKVDAIFFSYVTEVWFVAAKEGDRSPKNVREHPERKEAIMVNVEDRMTRKSFMAMIERSGERPSLLSWKESIAHEGRFARILPQHNPHKS